MPSPKTQPARGMRDFLPADVRKREYVIAVIKQVYERYGFEPLETPAVENIETLMGKYGEEGNQLIFKILKRGEHEKTGEADLALRYDLTVPLARVVAQYQNDLPKFFKRYQIQPVWRADRPARGRFREFYQCDVDVLGSQSMVVEAELIAAASDALVALGFKDFTIRLNHRQVLTGLMSAAGVPDDEHDLTLTILDKLDKIGTDAVEDELRTKVRVFRAAPALMQFYREIASLESAAQMTAGEQIEKKQAALNSAILGRLVEFIGNHEVGARGVDELRSIVDLTQQGVSTRVRLDPSLARGLSYYTGTIMEISIAGIGSLGGGGRYDNLVGMFLGKNVPACGFSLGLERIMVVMSERHMFPSRLVATPADVMATIWYEKGKVEKIEAAKESLSLAQELRSAGLRVDVYPVRNVKVPTQIAYAGKRNIPLVTIIGDDERARGEVGIKDLRTGDQHSVKREDVTRWVLDRMKADSRQSTIVQLVEPIRESLDKVGSKISELEQAVAGTYSNLRQEVEGLAMSQLQLRSETGSVVETSATPGIGGRWGEVQMERVIELSGTTQYCEFIQQLRVTQELASQPDAILHLPGGRTIALESKVPLNEFYEFVSATEALSRSHKQEAFVVALRRLINGLSRKEYLESVSPIPEFVLLFLPTENLFTAALEADAKILQDSFDTRVIIATPTTLLAFLKTVAFTWRQERLTTYAVEVSKLGEGMYDRLSVFTKQVDTQSGLSLPF